MQGEHTSFWEKFFFTIIFHFLLGAWALFLGLYHSEALSFRLAQFILITSVFGVASCVLPRFRYGLENAFIIFDFFVFFLFFLVALRLVRVLSRGI